jgi:hypothetical protein
VASGVDKLIVNAQGSLRSGVIERLEAYRKACNRRTSYDDQVQQDMRAFALAACWLDEALTNMGDVLGVQQREQRHEHA